MREVFILMKYNLTTLKIYSKQGRKFKFFCQIGLKYRKIVFKYRKYILNTLKSVSKYIWFGKGCHTDDVSLTRSRQCFQLVVQRGKFASTDQKNNPGLGSDTSSVWHFCSRSTVIISRETTDVGCFLSVYKLRPFSLRFMLPMVFFPQHYNNNCIIQ